MRKRSKDLERCPEALGCDLFDPEMQSGWTARIRNQQGKSDHRVEREMQLPPVFRPLGFNKPQGIGKIPDHEHKVKAGKRIEGFSAAAFVCGSSIFFRCSYTLERTDKNEKGETRHFWNVRNAWFELCQWAATSISEAVEMAAPYIASPHNSNMMIPILRKLKRPYWPSRPSNDQDHTTPTAPKP